MCKAPDLSSGFHNVSLVTHVEDPILNFLEIEYIVPPYTLDLEPKKIINSSNVEVFILGQNFHTNISLFCKVNETNIYAAFIHNKTHLSCWMNFEEYGKK